MQSEITKQIRNRITADIFADDYLYDYQSAMYQAELGSILTNSQAATFRGSKGGFEYVVTGSLRSKAWQVTTVRDGEPYSDYQADSIKDVLRELPDSGIDEVCYIPAERGGDKTMMLINSTYVSPDGSRIVDW